MKANSILLQKKYARITALLAERSGVNLDTALDIFYHSMTYRLMSEGVSDMHCMSDDYLVDEILDEKKSA